jgi:choline-glycine betaine transporter
MDVNFWSVPILSQTTMELPGKSAGQRIQRTTTYFNVRERRHHTLAVRWLNPVTLLKFLGWLLCFFVATYVFTLFVPGILASILKDKTPNWIFAVWGLVALVISTALARKGVLDRLMTRHALKERGLAAKTKIAIVPDKRWDRWAAKLK